MTETSAGNPDADRVLCYLLVTRLASVIGATEAVVFRLPPPEATDRCLAPVAHARGDQETSPKELMLKSFEILEQIARESVEKRKQAVCRLERDLWCLVSLLTDRGELRGAIAFVVSASDKAQALTYLDIIEGRRRALT